MAAEVIGLWGSNTGGNKLLAPTLIDVYGCICQNSRGPNILSLKAKASTTKVNTETVFLAFKSQWGKDEFALPVPTLGSGTADPDPHVPVEQMALQGGAVTGHLMVLHSIFLWISSCIQADKNHTSCSLVEDSWTGNKSFKKKQRGIRFSLGNKSASVSEIIHD